VEYRIADGAITYTGIELRRGFVARVTGLSGDAAAGFIGPCHVPTEHLVDLDDARAGAVIEAREMAHVIVEHPDCDLRAGVLRQRLLVCLLGEVLGGHGIAVERRGDDVFVDGRKLTVSIAAPANGTVLIHLGINVDPAGAPVAAIGLSELGVDARALLTDLLGRYADELDQCAYAQTKVRTVD
jgi:hypothetical protein